MTLDQVKAKLADITGARLMRAEQAIAAGLAIITNPATGKRAVVVGSKSGHGSYVVTGTGCTCKGWQSRGWCCHSDATYLMLVARAAAKAGATAPATEAGESAEYRAWVAAMAADEAQERTELEQMAERTRRDIEALYGPLAA